ncbi:hypothetical protein [Puia sp.]|jgi:hypothetical protein|uniref:hypothetical protein n=1 Tax=Puia sp. TaxID=2045100 RepID=UPI002F42EA9A
MNETILNKIAGKVGVADIAGVLAGLSGSELSSLLLAVYERKTEKMDPAELLAQYARNRLVQPSDLDMIALLEAELETLRFFRDRGFSPVELSPVSALGSCSVIATVSQDKIISGVRNTEVVADATNAIALHMADRRKGGGGGGGKTGDSTDGGGKTRDSTDGGGRMRCCTVHRHVRTQTFADKRFLPHFVIGCMVTAGRDMGGYEFESDGLSEHVGNLVELLREKYGVETCRLVLRRRGGYDERSPVMDRVMGVLGERLKGVDIERHPGDSEAAERDTSDSEKAGQEGPPAESNYYRGVQFKLYIGWGGTEWEIADGGFVDWTQQLLANKKERMLISGFGLELMFKMQQGLL